MMRTRGSTVIVVVFVLPVLVIVIVPNTWPPINAPFRQALAQGLQTALMALLQLLDDAEYLGGSRCCQVVQKVAEGV
ncbi:hypothetical protein C8J98_102609 [Luteibacter sp. OK325]|uniref:hypothetical protein n=1 Tax=Luteibacter sp. OK325 TaxID=2135670 RepID=UPI000D3A9333|nr:hypothetical protein [Luteibacter sp. OK325]PTR34421.1 hypothetical protein C8J98_102609 [Luteibacter sp. OK325]